MDEYVQTSMNFDNASPTVSGNPTKRLVLYADYVSGDVDAVSVLNATLGEYGLHVDVRDDDGKTKRVEINFDTRQFRKKTSRGAGAKQKYVGKAVPVVELRGRIDAEGAQAVADEIGVSRSTLFRRIKECENCGEPDVLL